MIVTLAALALGAALGAAAPADAPAAWADFVDRPSRRTYERVSKALEGCTGAACAPDAKVVGLLVKLVSLGHPIAVDAAMDAYGLVAGDSRVALAVALGKYADAQPGRFLRTARDHRLSPKDLATIVRTPPPGAADEASRREALERRRQALSTVEEPEVATERVVVLDALSGPVQPARQGRTPPLRGG